MGNPQCFNRYSYCLNNPLKYTDPSGHDVEINGISDKEIMDALNSGDYNKLSEYGNDPIRKAFGKVLAESPEVAMGLVDSVINFSYQKGDVQGEDNYGETSGDGTNSGEPVSQVTITIDINKITDGNDGDLAITFITAHETGHASVMATSGIAMFGTRYEESLCDRLAINITGKLGHHPFKSSQLNNRYEMAERCMTLNFSSVSISTDISNAYGQNFWGRLTGPIAYTKLRADPYENYAYRCGLSYLLSSTQ
jgi:hypothetical protein